MSFQQCLEYKGELFTFRLHMLKLYASSFYSLILNNSKIYENKPIHARITDALYNGKCANKAS